MLDGATGSPLAELWLTTEIAAPAGSLRAPSAETGEGADRENQRKSLQVFWYTKKSQKITT